MATEQGKRILELIRKEEKKGNVVLQMFDGNLISMNIDDAISQPTEGLLWDLNRDKVTCATWIEAEEMGWINNYAVALVITKLKELWKEAEDNYQAELEYQAGASL